MNSTNIVACGCVIALGFAFVGAIEAMDANAATNPVGIAVDAAPVIMKNDRAVEGASPFVRYITIEVGGSGASTVLARVEDATIF